MKQGSSVARKSINSWTCADCRRAQAVHRRFHILSAKRNDNQEPGSSRHDALEDVEHARSMLRPYTLRNTPTGTARALYATYIPDAPDLPQTSAPLTISPSNTVTETSNDYANRICRALKQQSPHECILALREANEHDPPEQLLAIPRATWSEILKLVDIRTWAVSRHKLHRSFGEINVQKLGVDTDHIHAKMMRFISEISTIRQRIDLNLDITDYRILLKQCAHVGHKRLATALWLELKSAGITPDLECYNALLHCTIFGEDDRIPLKQNTSGELSVATNATVKRLKKASILPGALTRVKDIFEEMKIDHVNPDIQTYCSLMIAYTQNGTMGGVLDLLKSLWGIDISVLKEGYLNIPQNKTYQLTHPLYPNVLLLRTITEAFGSQNQIAVAMQLLAYLSRTYNLKIERNIWHCLIDWSWTHAIVERDKDRFKGLPRSQTFLDRVWHIFNTMSSAPHDIDPTFDILNAVFKTGRSRYLLGTPEHTLSLELGMDLYIRAVNERRSRRHTHNSVKRIASPGSIPSAKSESQLAQQNLLATTRVQEASIFMKRWAREVVHQGLPDNYETTPLEAERIADWRLRGLSHFLIEWKQFLPTEVRYQIATGTVRLKLHSKQDLREHKTRRSTVNAKALARPIKRENITFKWNAVTRLTRGSKPWTFGKNIGLTEAEITTAGL